MADQPRYRHRYIWERHELEGGDVALELDPPPGYRLDHSLQGQMGYGMLLVCWARIDGEQRDRG